MDVLAALSKAADVTRPGARDQLPVASVVLTVAALVAAGAPERVPMVSRLISAVKGLGGIGFTVLILGVIATSILLQPLLTYISAVISGAKYIPWLRWLTDRLRRRHFRRMKILQERRIAAIKALDDLNKRDPEIRNTEDRDGRMTETFRLYEILGNVTAARQRYPRDVKLLMPTLLGNVLRAAEISAGGRYGFDTLIVFPRLEPLLPANCGPR